MSISMNRSSYYDTMQVCSKCGHVITSMYDEYPVHRQNYCEMCGGTTVIECVFCKEKIRGYYHVAGVIGSRSLKAPLNCHACGRSYSWKRKVLFKVFLKSLISPVKYIVDGFLGIFKK